MKWKKQFFPQILSALFLHNRLVFLFQIWNIGQLWYVVVPFSHFSHVMLILGNFGWKKHCFLPQILSALILHNHLEFSFQILNIGQWGCVVVPFSRFIHVTHILGIFGWKTLFFAPNLVCALSPIPLGVFLSNFKHKSVGECSCAFFTFHSSIYFIWLPDWTWDIYFVTRQNINATYVVNNPHIMIVWLYLTWGKIFMQHIHSSIHVKV